MSSAGNGTSGPNAAGGSSKPYFCYQCDRNVAVTGSASTDPCCPLCGGGFIEEHENPDPNPEPTYQNSPSHPLLPLLLPSALLTPSSSAATAGGMEMDVLDFFQNHMINLRNSGAQIEFLIDENHRSETGFGPVNLGDYFIGPDLEQFFQQLSENDAISHGPPPASESAINSLPSVRITDQLLNSDRNQCPVCMDKFEEGNQVKQMPCKHLYHEDCIFPWLKSHNSCPVCRYELPTDDEEYNRRMNGGQGSSGSNSGGRRVSSRENRIFGRRIRRGLPSRIFGSGSGSGIGGGSETRHDYGGLD